MVSYMKQPSRGSIFIWLVIGAVLMASLAVITSARAVNDSVTIGNQQHAINGTNVFRSTNFLVLYTPANGATTGTNIYGYEAAVVNGVVTQVQNSVGNMAIPSNGYVLSGHGTSRTWLQNNATVGAAVVLDGVPPPPPPTGNQFATVGGSTKAINGTNVARATNFLVLYTPAKGATTGTNVYGFEAAVVNNVVTQVANGIGNMAIPSNGYVLSGHGEARTWLQINATIGATVTLSDTPPAGGNQLLPDVGIQTLGGFLITNVNGVKLLKFPGVTSNVGAGPLEVNASRSSTSTQDWVGRQSVLLTSGVKEVLPANGLEFYYAGDGHTHWHMRDFDAYELFDASGTKLLDGEKHGFCFEDNSHYQNWPGSAAHPTSPANPVYTHTGSCGQGLPNATSIQHGLSVGWGDTYPATLPDQGINITGIPNGTYTVKVTADWHGFIKESNDNNNSASARIQINNNAVTLLSANDGL